jgi:DNA-binding NtrC family response regulator
MQLERIAPTDAEVLIAGPTGVGKELYARYIHRCSPRSACAFVAINCGALPSDLFENELFGHVGGAFTGARQHRVGLVEEAEAGTLFLDEIDSLTPPCQVKLLRLLQEREYRRLGESRTRRANVRTIAATNSDLLAAVRERRLREDLFFRLRVFPIDVPPLRDRPEDIEPILDDCSARYASAYRLPRITFSVAAMSRVLSYQWPGNVRELENCVRYLTCLQLSRPIVPNDLPLLDLPSDGKVSSPMTASAESSINSWNVQRPLREAKRELVRRFEREYLDQALRATHGNIASAARRSGKARRAFFELMRKHGINAADYNGAVAVPMPERKVEAAGLVAPEIRSDGSGDAATDLRRELRHQVPSSGVFQ